MKKCTVTIVSPEYENQYRVSLASLKEFLPDWDHHKVSTESDMVQGLKTDYPYTEMGRFICAIRPAIVRQFLEQYEKVLFLGADVVFYAHPEEFEEDTHEAIVVPHITSSIPLGGDSPDLSNIIQTGHINSDIVLWTNSPRILAFLEWQAEVQKTNCSNSPGLFLDQVWLNCLPFFIDDVKILRHPGYNIAYFNTKERGVRYEDNTWYVNGYEKLVCAQFSGFIPGQPERMSKHTSYPEAKGDLLKLFQEYDQDLMILEFMEDNKQLMQNLAK